MLSATPSFTLYVNESLPTYPAAGVYQNEPSPLSATPPWLGPLTRIAVSRSIGALLVTLIDSVASVLLATPSLALYVKESQPAGSGEFAAVPLPFALDDGYAQKDRAGETT